MWAAIIAGAVVFLLIGGLVMVLVGKSESGATAKDDLAEAKKAAKLRGKAERAQAAERKKNDRLR